MLISLPPGEAFLDAVAAAMLERCNEFPGLTDRSDLSSVLVFAPALPIAAELRQAMVRVAGKPLLLPAFETLSHWVQTAVVSEIQAPLPDSERLVLLHEALRERQWFDEGALWGIASEMAGLFDELTAAAIHLPEDESALAVQLERAYALRASTPLVFEARVVHELWRALSAAGRPDAAGVYRLRLGRLAELAEKPLLVLLDAAPNEALDPAEHDFLLRYAARQPVAIFYPAPRATIATPLLATLAAAWPESPVLANDPLHDRALALAVRLPDSPLVDRLQLVPTAGREQEALAVVAQVGKWLGDGLRRIVLITQDRLTARRVRALLEREGILVVDETGWLLSTSRAAAAVDALIETAAGDAYYRDLLDLCKSPYVFADCDASERKSAVFALESVIRRASLRSGLQRFRRCLVESDDKAVQASKALGITLLDRIEAARSLLRSRPATLPRWIDRLHKALEALAAQPLLLKDPAGKALLELLANRRQELDGSTALFSFAAWRDWLNREFEATNFRDGSIASPIVLTPLNAVCLRRFEAALLIGGDARQLTPAASGAFFNQSVRRELGLPTHEQAECELRRDLELLLATVPRVVVTWQAEHEGEANLLAPELDLLATLHQLAWGDNLHRQPLPARHEASPARAIAPGATLGAAPVAPEALIPRRISVSGYTSLVACPYRFFARHILGLGEMDEVSEEMGKSDYGALVHRVLERFHARYPLILGLPENEALEALQACVTEVFAPAVEDNFLAIGWRLRWEKRQAAYLDWQRGVETVGWRWSQAETRVSRLFPLENGIGIELYGRIDRVDTIGLGAASVSLLDYKTQTATKIRERLVDDVQLPAYALLHGDAAQAGYVALDDERIVTVAAGDDEGSLMFDAAAQGRRLRDTFDAMYAGSTLPAHGTISECKWCEMGGLCRSKYV